MINSVPKGITFVDLKCKIPTTTFNRLELVAIARGLNCEAVLVEAINDYANKYAVKIVEQG